MVTMVSMTGTMVSMTGTVPGMMPDTMTAGIMRRMVAINNGGVVKPCMVHPIATMTGTPTGDTATMQITNTCGNSITMNTIWPGKTQMNGIMTTMVAMDHGTMTM